MNNKRYALISVYYKDGIVDFAVSLQALGFTIVSSGGTAKHLKKNGLSNVIDAAEITSFPPILDHRVVTLHPKIHGGILAKNTPEHDEELKKYSMNRFEIICVDLYPVEEAIAKPEATIESVMELTDIGGPTMIRGAAKNHNNGVTVICDPKDRKRVIDELQFCGKVRESTRANLAEKVFSVMSKYDAAIRKYLAKTIKVQDTDTLFLGPAKELAYAENKDANPAKLHPLEGNNDPLALHRLEEISGDPSYISMADTGQLIDILCRLAEAFRLYCGRVPYIALAGKHGNPCGAAIDWQNPVIAIRKALNGNSVAVMGGEVVVNFPITDELGKELYAPTPESRLNIGRPNWGLDIISAPSFSKNAIELLGQREKRRLLVNKYLVAPVLQSDEWELKTVRGGFLKQKTPRFILKIEEAQELVGEYIWHSISSEEIDTLFIAWAVCWRASSNTVALAKDRMLIGLGCGQQDRIECVRLCINRASGAGHSTKGSIFASDAFFPYPSGKLPSVKEIMSVFKSFKIKKIPTKPRQLLVLLNEFILNFQRLDKREGPELLIDAGCIGGVVPADGKNFPLVKEIFGKAGLSIVFLKKENRGFAKHA